MKTMLKNKRKKSAGGNKAGLLALAVLVIGLAAGVVAVQNRTELTPSAKELSDKAEIIDLQDSLENMAVPAVEEDDERYTQTVVVCPEGAPTKKTDCQYWGGDGISGAAERAANGQRILVKSGEYFLVNGRQILLENKSNVGIVGEAGGKVTIKTDSDYSLSVIDIKSTGTPMRNIVVKGLIIRRNPPERVSGAVISISGDVKARIRQNKIFSGGRGFPILVIGGAQARIIGNVLTSDNDLEKDNWTLENLDQASFFGAGVSVLYNSSAFIERNVIAKNYIGIIVVGKSGQETIIKNNTFVRNGSVEEIGPAELKRGGGVFVGGENGDVRIYNNIFFNSGKAIHRFLTPFPHTGQFVENNNLFFPDIGSAEGEIGAFVTPDRTDLVGVHPQFAGKVSALLGRWRPKEGSPVCKAADNGGFIGAFSCTDRKN